MHHIYCMSLITFCMTSMIEFKVPLNSVLYDISVRFRIDFTTTYFLPDVIIR